MQILLLLLTAFVSGKNVKSFFEDQQFHDALMFVDSIATLTAAGNEARRLAEADGSGEDDTKDESASVAASSKLVSNGIVVLPMILFPGLFYLVKYYWSESPAADAGFKKKVWDMVDSDWMPPIVELFSVVVAAVLMVALPEKQLKDDDSEDSDDEDNEDMSAASQSGLWAKAKGYGALLGVPLIALVVHSASVQFEKPWAADGSKNTYLWFGSIAAGFLIQFGLSML